MSRNSHHSVKIVWDDPSKEVNLTYPKRDFTALNRRVKRRKRLVTVLKAAVILVLLIGVVMAIKLSKRVKDQPEIPVTSMIVGPTSEVRSFDWSTIGTVKLKKVTPKSQEKENSDMPMIKKSQSEIQIDSMQVAKAITEEVPVSINTRQKRSELLPSGKTDSSTDSSNQVKKPFVPSKFVRAYPKVGFDSLYQYLIEHINKELLGSTNTGDTLRISFAIEADGHPSDIKLSINTSDSIFMKIEEVVQEMPIWEPAKADGQPIVTRFRLPLIIQAQAVKEEE